jgi:ornithine carbamoyltransferase
LKGKDLLSISDLSSEDIRLLISDAVDMKAEGWLSVLSGKTLALLFEKPSLRTRVSFEVAMRQLGGHTIYLSPAEVGLGERESVSDVARVLSRYVDAIAARTFSHQTLEILASYSSVPVINALSDLEHPCQALADLFTIYEKKGELDGLTLAFVGDGNNVAHSLLLAASLAGMNFRIASPSGYRVQDRILHLAQEYAVDSGAEIFCTEEPRLAVSGADVVYTDVWTSMGQEAEAERRRQILANYQVNNELLSLAREDAILMHPLPAHHGEEVAEGILDSSGSVVFDQAENRMHLQKTLLAEILGGLEIPLAGYR